MIETVMIGMQKTVRDNGVSFSALKVRQGMSG